MGDNHQKSKLPTADIAVDCQLKAFNRIDVPQRYIVAIIIGRYSRHTVTYVLCNISSYYWPLSLVGVLKI